MSRIGKKALIIPAGVEVSLKPGAIEISGKKGKLQFNLHPHVTAEFKEYDGGKALFFSVTSPQDKKDRSLWGLSSRLVANMMHGVTNGYEEKLEVIGIGYKASVSGRKLALELGFSHPIEFELPQGIEAKVEKNFITISGIDKQLVGETASRIRRLRKPEPYKGKGIKYIDEVIHRKAGKAVKTGAAAK